MNQRFLAPFAWICWGILVLALLYGLTRVSGDRGSPEASRGLGTFVLGALLIFMVIVGGLLYLAIRKQSAWGVGVIASFVGFPVVLLIAQPIVMRLKTRSYERADAAIGSFADSSLAAMARAIESSDTTTLSALLGGKAPPSGKDGAGNDLLAWSLVMFRDKQGQAAPVRVLLEAGADPKVSRAGDPPQDVINFLVNHLDGDGIEVFRLLLQRGADPNIRDAFAQDVPLSRVYDNAEAVRLLVEHGADINAKPRDGSGHVTNFVARKAWDAAVYMINKGAPLDGGDINGTPLDYYLNEKWKESVDGEHPEGWERVKAALAARRRQSPQ
jgi:hypothetical protein